MDEGLTQGHWTPGPATHDYPASAEDLPPLSRITAILAITEPTVDAALELLSTQSRYSKSRRSRIPATSPASDVSLEALLTWTWLPLATPR